MEEFVEDHHINAAKKSCIDLSGVNGELGSGMNGDIGTQIQNIDDAITRILAQEAVLRKKRKKLEAQKYELEQRRNIEEAHASSKVDWSGRFEWSQSVEGLMKDVFGISSGFRPNQREAINATLSGKDVFVVMRTGGGKSLLYQLPALLPPPQKQMLTVVVCPLLSLMWDQAREVCLRRPGGAAFLSAGLDRAEASLIYKQMKDLPNSPLRIIFVTPEKVEKSKLFLGVLQKVYDAGRLARFVVDEAHCCSQWGHEYRPDYARLGRLRALCPAAPLLALTATASAAVQEDVAGLLRLHPGYLTFRSGFNRPNLFYEVRPRADKFDASVEEMAASIQQEFRGQSGIIYLFSQKEVDRAVAGLRGGGVRAGAYHAGHEDADKRAVHAAWAEGRLQVVCATIAFGMGINKADVRFVFHHSMSKSLEHYLQESGRAGRDGAPAVCRLYHRAADTPRQACQVFYERQGLTNLRQMAAYCRGADIGGCRRVALARALGERWSPEKEEEEEGAPGGRRRCCDLCEAGRQDGPRLRICTLEDSAQYARGLIRLCHDLEEKSERVTMKKLVERWKVQGRSKAGSAKKGNRSKDTVDRAFWGPPSSFSAEDSENYLSHLIDGGILQEDFHQTAYSTVCYVVLGHASQALSGGGSCNLEISAGTCTGVYNYLCYCSTGKCKHGVKDREGDSSTNRKEKKGDQVIRKGKNAHLNNSKEDSTAKGKRKRKEKGGVKSSLVTKSRMIIDISDTSSDDSSDGKGRATACAQRKQPVAKNESTTLDLGVHNDIDCINFNEDDDFM